MTLYPLSRMRAASCEMPASRGSVGPSRKLAQKPPDTPAKAAASPASGCRPTAENHRAERYHEHVAHVPGHVRQHAREDDRHRQQASRGRKHHRASAAEISPLPSATAMPSIATSTVPSGAKPVKFVTSEVRMRCSPATFRRLRPDDLLRAGVDDRDAHPRRDGREQDDEQCEDDEQRRRVRQDVPGLLNRPEEAIHERVFGDAPALFVSCAQVSLPEARPPGWAACPTRAPPRDAHARADGLPFGQALPLPARGVKPSRLSGRHKEAGAPDLLARRAGLFSQLAFYFRTARTPARTR